ncbi:SMI1/KNR4 family protein [Sphingosinicella sp.]|uniref:SMI1/KNR4 family protein n=1 Tax=Sphingosinicella sp. TaxID=1917971 RepID=UPI00403801F3
MSRPFEGFDFTEFWEKGEYALRDYLEPPPTDLDVARVEKELGYRLPLAYVELCRHQNGGMPINAYHRMAEETSWADDHIAINGILAIGRTKSCSLCGSNGSRFYINEWGYPPIGVYFADCPSAGHDMICLDYTQCGSRGEPQVVHVDQESDYRVTFIASNFEAFIRGLEPAEAFPVPEDIDAGIVRADLSGLDEKN